jgi:hypothetical protein
MPPLRQPLHPAWGPMVEPDFLQVLPLRAEVFCTTTKGEIYAQLETGA